MIFTIENLFSCILGLCFKLPKSYRKEVISLFIKKDIIKLVTFLFYGSGVLLNILKLLLGIDHENVRRVKV